MGQILPSPVSLGQSRTGQSKITQISGTYSGANQKYNSLQATLRKRFSMGFEYKVAYTWQKGMSDSIGYYGEGGQAGGQSAYMQNLYDRARNGVRPTSTSSRTSWLVRLRGAFRTQEEVRHQLEPGSGRGSRRLAAGRHLHRA